MNMLKIKNPADFYIYYLTEIINEEYLFNSPYEPAKDLMYGEKFSIFGSRKNMREYCLQFYSKYYAENRWQYFPILYQFQDLDVSKKINEDFYTNKEENDCQLQANFLKSVLHDLMLDDFRQILNESKKEILNHYLEENHYQLSEYLKKIDQQLSQTVKVLDFLKEELKQFESNSPLHDIIVYQQKNLLDNHEEMVKKYVNNLAHYMATYCEEEMELFQEILKNHITLEKQPTNA